MVEPGQRSDFRYAVKEKKMAQQELDPDSVALFRSLIERVMAGETVDDVAEEAEASGIGSDVLQSAVTGRREALEDEKRNQSSD